MNTLKTKIPFLFGSGSIPVLLLILVASALTYGPALIDYTDKQTLDQRRTRYPLVTIDYKQLVDEFRAKPVPTSNLTGTYISQGEKSKGKKIRATYFFDDDTVTKEVTLVDFLSNKTFGGSANYRFDGSVMVFDNVVGDKYLFPPLGEPVSIVSSTLFTSYHPDYQIPFLSRAALAQETTTDNNLEAIKAFHLAIVIVLFLMVILIMVLKMLMRR